MIYFNWYNIDLPNVPRVVELTFLYYVILLRDSIKTILLWARRAEAVEIPIRGGAIKCMQSNRIMKTTPTRSIDNFDQTLVDENGKLEPRMTLHIFYVPF